MTADTKPGGRDDSIERAVTPQVDRFGEADGLLVWRHGGRIDGGLPVRAEAETLRVDSWKPARNPGGERSPWKKRAAVHWQRWWPQRTRQRSKASRSRVTANDIGNGARSGGTTARGQRPQRCGAAAGGGTSSRGVNERSRGSLPPTRPPSPADYSCGCCLRAAGEWSQVAETLRTPSGTGMQQAWDLIRGENRRDGAKP